MEKVTIEYFGHSCFRLTHTGQRIVLDPYADGSVPGLPPLRTEAEYVYCSHGHGDHNAVQCVKLAAPAPAPNFTMEELLTDHDDAGGKLRGKNTVRVFDFGGLRAAHLGDLGRELTAEEQAKLSGLDLVMIPVGGYYTIDAATAKKVLQSIRPRAAVLMHYRTDTSGYDVISHLDDIVRAMGDVVFAGDTFELTSDTPAQIVIMKTKNII